MYIISIFIKKCATFSRRQFSYLEQFLVNALKMNSLHKKLSLIFSVYNQACYDFTFKELQLLKGQWHQWRISHRICQWKGHINSVSCVNTSLEECMKWVCWNIFNVIEIKARTPMSKRICLIWLKEFIKSV